MLFDLLPRQWQEALPSSKHLLSGIEINGDFIPEKNRIFIAFEQPISEIKVCIVGQDPYPNPKHAMGLAFSVNSDVTPLPSSLRNIFTELENDLGYKRTNGDLSDWNDQGVLLLNRTLTVAPSK